MFLLGINAELSASDPRRPNTFMVGNLSEAASEWPFFPRTYYSLASEKKASRRAILLIALAKGVLTYRTIVLVCFSALHLQPWGEHS